MQKTLLMPGDYAAFPQAVQKLTRGCKVYDSSCSDTVRVYYLDSGLFVKEGAAGSLAHEAEMGRIFHQRHLGPEVLDYLTGEKDYLITREVTGQDLCHHTDKPELICCQMGEKLRLLHSQPCEDVPTAPAFALYERTLNGAISDKGFEKYVLLDSFAIATKEDAWQLAQKGRESLQQEALIHGDACLPNMMMENGEITSFIDFSCSGLGDRHIDLFWAVWSLSFNLKTEKYTDYFLDCYGRQQVEREKLRLVAACEAFG